MTQSRQMILGAVMRGTGSHVAGWRHPAVSHEMLEGARRLDHYLNIAQLAESGKLHFVFTADSPAVTYQNMPELMRRAAQDYYLEPLTLLSALAATTRHIGLVGSASTTYADPYMIARLFASLDHLSDGRASWNVVTTFEKAAAGNFGRDVPFAPDQRYARAKEFVQIVRRLWDSWEDDAFTRDQQTGQFVDPAKLHLVDHHSDFFHVHGALNVERSPQAHPVIFVAASSEDGRELAAAEADAMFTAQPEIEAGRRFYTDVKGRMARYGRTPDELAILLGAMIITGHTDEEAQQKHTALKAAIDIDFGVLYLSSLIGMNLSHLPLDEPLPDALRDQPNWSRVPLVMDIARRGNMTFRDIALHYADQYGHQCIVGSPATIADALQAMFEAPVADGFLLRSPFYPDSLEDIVSLVIPELQRRGLFRSEYVPGTLRDNLGLRRPAHPAAQEADRPSLNTSAAA
jgi:N-acetyl-S-(2-succino)cysteine monooxygenase